MNQSLFSYGFLNNGLVYSKQGKFNKAIKEYNKAIEESPQYAAAYHNRGNAYQSLAILEEAIKDYTIAIKINPLYNAVYFNRGLVYGKQGKFEEAIIDYTQFIQMVIEIQYNFIKLTLNNLPCCNFKNLNLKFLQDKIFQLTIIIEVIKIIQVSENAYQNLGNFNEAISDYSKSIEINPQYSVAYNNRGKFDDAIIDCSKAIQLNRENADAFYIRVKIILDDQQMLIKIKENMKKQQMIILKLFNQILNMLQLIIIEIFEKAIIDNSKAIEILPTNPQYYFSLDFLYFSLKQFNQANQNFQKAIQCSLKVSPLLRYQFQLSKDKMIFLQSKVEILTYLDKEIQNVNEEIEYLLKKNSISEIQHKQYQSQINNIDIILLQLVPSKSTENQEEVLQKLKQQMEEIKNLNIEISKLKSNQDYEIEIILIKQILQIFKKLLLIIYNLQNIISSDCFLINYEFNSKPILEIIQKIEKINNPKEGFIPIIDQTFCLINASLDLNDNIQEIKCSSRVFNLKQILQAFAICTSEYEREIEKASLYLMNNIKYTYEKNHFNTFELFVEKISILEIDYEEYSQSNFWKTGILHILIILKYLEENYQYIINQSSVCSFKDIIVRSINEFNPESLAIEYIKQQ
ncbi:unnamed protein product [Paramecium pentaurelia]|uniref:Tetratricopeptide repeat protein n=1 Tax=Paramecium pentaurelia TaxID=43138 RepID=A0A8S1XD38_9CILI|nr:unnamed protein product [Paramecium pentaurelia]